MYCSHCGRQIPDNSAFCPECGRPVERPDEVNVQAEQYLNRYAVHNQPDSRSKNEKTKRIAVILLILVLIAVLAVLVLLKFGPKRETSPAQSTPVSQGEPTGEPEPVSEPEPIVEPDPDPEPAAEPDPEPESAAAPAVTMDAVTGVSASSALSEYGVTHEASRVIDGNLTTAWVEGAAGQGLRETLTLTLEGERLVSGFTIYAGYHKTAELYQKNSRPRLLLVTFADGSEETFELSDAMTAQSFTFSAPAETDAVTFTILTVYPGTVYEDTVISELSLF